MYLSKSDEGASEGDLVGEAESVGTPVGDELGLNTSHSSMLLSKLNLLQSIGPVKEGLPTAGMNKTKTNGGKTNNIISSGIRYYALWYIYKWGFEYLNLRKFRLFKSVNFSISVGMVL